MSTFNLVNGSVDSFSNRHGTSAGLFDGIYGLKTNIPQVGISRCLEGSTELGTIHFGSDRLHVLHFFRSLWDIISADVQIISLVEISAKMLLHLNTASIVTSLSKVILVWFVSPKPSDKKRL